MLENQNKDKEFLGSSQRFSLSNNTRINSKLQDNQWGQFDDDWIIPIAEIPEEKPEAAPAGGAPPGMGGMY